MKNPLKLIPWRKLLGLGAKAALEKISEKQFSRLVEDRRKLLYLLYKIGPQNIHADVWRDIDLFNEKGLGVVVVPLSSDERYVRIALMTVPEEE